MKPQEYIKKYPDKTGSKLDKYRIEKNITISEIIGSVFALPLILIAFYLYFKIVYMFYMIIKVNF